MPFPTTVVVSRTIRAPAARGDALTEQVARRLRAAGLAGVSTGQSVVNYDPSAAGSGATTLGSGPGLLGPVEIEVIERGAEVELVAESHIGRVPLAFGTATLLSATLVGGAHTFSLAGGLIGGALVAVVPWVIARIRLSAMLSRIALAVPTDPSSDSLAAPPPLNPPPIVPR